MRQSGQDAGRFGDCGMKLSLRSLWLIARRDLSTRIRGLRLLAVCLFLGVATLAAIGSLTSGITSELARRGQTVLGGDLEIAMSQRKATDAELLAFRKAGRLSETIRMRAMAVTWDRTDNMLAELKAVDSAYPLYGDFRLASGHCPRAGITPNKPIPSFKNGISFGRTCADMDRPILVSPALAARFNLDTGDQVRFGNARFDIAGIIEEEPDRLGEGFTLGPVAIINLQLLEQTGLIQPGSLYESKYRIKLPTTVDPIADGKSLQAQFPDAGWKITDRSNGAGGTRRFIERMGQFLTLVGLAALVIAGIGVGNGVSSYLASKKPCIATLKVLGGESRDIFRIYFMQIGAVAIFAILAGLVVGSLAPSIITYFARDVLPVAPGFAIHPAPLLTSAAYGVLIATLFAYIPLLQARTVPAASLFRGALQKSNKPDNSGWPVIGLGMMAIVVLAMATTGEPLFSVAFIAASLLLLLILAGISRAIKSLAKRIPHPRTPVRRLALTNLYRPGSQTFALVIALGLGLTLFVTLTTIQTSIKNEIARAVPQRAPSFFALDIPQDKVARFDTIVRDQAPGAAINMIPAMRGRIVAFKGQRVDQMHALPERAWALRGDRGLTYSVKLPQGSALIDGKWWKDDYNGEQLVSVEEEVAKSLNLQLGDMITVNLMGVEIDAKVASFRRVEWDNFGLNYVLVFSPGLISRAPHNMMATLTVPKTAEASLQRLLPQAFPSSSLIKVSDVVKQVNELLGQMSTAIAAAASVTILAGIAVLVGAIAAARQSRIYDSVILKLLGATRKQILTMQLIEYGSLALIMGLVGLVLGLAAGWYVVVQIFSFNFSPDPFALFMTLVGGTGLTFLLGMAGSLPVLNSRPAEALRNL
jgi:putative ABC transport system permease protein